jgi:hypothetical protein
MDSSPEKIRSGRSNAAPRTVPGASPDTMASSVATPLERQFSAISGVESMTSVSTLGSTQLALQFDLGRSIDGAAVDLVTAINAATPLLPPGMPSPPSFRKSNPAAKIFICYPTPDFPGRWGINEKTIREEDILTAIDEHGDSLALSLFGGINYYSGQFFDIKTITKAVHKAGAIAGFDLAHTIGNVQTHLHDWEVDFAAWCSYKYLNAGPGAVSGIYIHEKYATNKSHSRMGGWWGNDEKTRFKMEKGFVPKPDASGWNQSTAAVFNMVALKASLELFDAAGMEKICAKSRLLTGYLSFLLKQLKNIRFNIITPDESEKRGAQLCLSCPRRTRATRARRPGLPMDCGSPTRSGPTGSGPWRRYASEALKRRLSFGPTAFPTPRRRGRRTTTGSPGKPIRDSSWCLRTERASACCPTTIGWRTPGRETDCGFTASAKPNSCGSRLLRWTPTLGTLE